MATDVRYQFVIRDEQDLEDVLVLSSEPSDAHPYLTDAPEIDGPRADLLESTVDVGVATIRAWDMYEGLAPTQLVNEGFNYADDAALAAAGWLDDSAPAPWITPYQAQDGGGFAALEGSGMLGVGGSIGAISDPISGGRMMKRKTYTLTPNTPVRVSCWVNMQLSAALAVMYLGLEVTGATGTDSDSVIDSSALSWTKLQATGVTNPDGTIDVAVGSVDATAINPPPFYRFAFIDQLEIWEDVEGPGHVVTRQLHDLRGGVARLTQLSKPAITRKSLDGGATWTDIHRGYLTSIEVEGGEWTFRVGDTMRLSRAQIFATLPALDPAALPDPLPMPAPRVGYILGGPIEADPTYGLFANIVDYGETRWEVDEQHDDQGPLGVTRVLRLKFKSGYLRPWYAKTWTTFKDPANDERDTVNHLVDRYFVPDWETYISPSSASVNYFGYFADLTARLTAVSDSSVTEAMPIARPVTHEPGAYPTQWQYPKAEEDALVGNDSTMYLAWEDRPWPGIGAQFDVVLYSPVIDQDNPLLLQGHPVDLVAYAWALAGYTVEPTSRATIRAALGDGLWVQLLETPQEMREFAQRVGKWFGFLSRLNVATNEIEFVTTRIRPTPSFAITDADRVDGSEDGSSQPTIWKAAEDSVVNVVKFTSKKLRRFLYKQDEGRGPVHMIATADASVEGARGDTAVYGEQAIEYALPGQPFRRALDGGMERLLLRVDDPAHAQYPGYAVDAGGVIVDYAGWGVPHSTVLVDEASPEAAAREGDEGTIDHADLPVPDEASVPLTQRGLKPRVVRVIQKSIREGVVEFTFAHAGQLSQTAVAEPAPGGVTGPPTPTAPTISLAASTVYPQTVATVTITNGATLAVDTIRVDLEYLEQTTTPDPSDSGTAFGPIYPDDDLTTIDTPPVAPASTVWVRARGVNPTAGTASAWTAWTSVTLGGVYEDVLADFGSGYVVVVADFGSGNDVVQADF
jgi:hypothetical protein